jgi:hypothetical protein
MKCLAQNKAICLTISFLLASAAGCTGALEEPAIDMEASDKVGGRAVAEATDVALLAVPEELYIGKTNYLYAVDSTTGSGYKLNPDQPFTVAMASTGGFIYLILDSSHSRLYKVTPSTGAYNEVSPGASWPNTDAMTALGGYVYAVQGGTLWRVSGSNGLVEPFSDYPDGWSGTEAMAAVGGMIYAVQGGTLWRVNVSNGDVSPFSDYPDGWAGTEAMGAYGSYVYAVQGGTLWRVNVANGSVAPFSNYPDGWAGTAAMTARDGYIFAVQAGTLWKVNTLGGGVSQVGSLSWAGTTAMAARL